MHMRLPIFAETRATLMLGPQLLPTNFFSLTSSFSEPRACWFGFTGWPASLRVLPASTSPTLLPNVGFPSSSEGQTQFLYAYVSVP